MGTCIKSLMTSLNPEKGEGKKNQTACDSLKNSFEPRICGIFPDDKRGGMRKTYYLILEYSILIIID